MGRCASPTPHRLRHSPRLTGFCRLAALQYATQAPSQSGGRVSSGGVVTWRGAGSTSSAALEVARGERLAVADHAAGADGQVLGIKGRLA